MANQLGKKQDYKLFSERAQSWKNLFDPQTGNMRPKRNGGWESPFDPREVNNNFTEGNSWQYSFFVPHDIPGLIEAHGSNQELEAKLDEMFTAPSETTGREQVDITGLIGQYAHGNEPSHHMVYLYNYVGRPEKTREKVKYILNEFYKNTPDGLIGNEDCGQMSAWYVLSSMGIYPMTPGTPRWTATDSYFDSIKVHFEDGTTGFIGKATSTKEKEGFGFKHIPFSSYALTAENPICEVPVFSASKSTFKGELQVEISGKGNVFYRIGEGDFKPYNKPLRITKTSMVEAYAIDEHGQSKTVRAKYHKAPDEFTVVVTSIPNPQYRAGGPDALVDGVLGSENWRKGNWQGYQSQDFECYVFLKKKRKVNSIEARFLQDTRSWILMPTKVEFYSADENQKYTLLKSVDNTVDPKDMDSIVREFRCDVPVTTRRIAIKAYNFGKLPDWHQGKGGDAFIFIDEIVVK